MKKVLVILGMVLLLLFTSCTSMLQLNIIPMEKSFYGIDFRPYTEKGFFMTTENYDGEYESIGLITYELMPEAKYDKTGVKLIESTQKYVQTYSWVVGEVNMVNALDGIYENCVSMGANALINVKIKPIQKNYTNIKNPIVLSGYEISGYAIKRK